MGIMKRFRHKITGLEADYPDHFGDLPFLDLEPVEPGDETPCFDCSVQLEDDSEDEEE